MIEIPYKKLTPTARHPIRIDDGLVHWFFKLDTITPDQDFIYPVLYQSGIAVRFPDRIWSDARPLSYLWRDGAVLFERVDDSGWVEIQVRHYADHALHSQMKQGTAFVRLTFHEEPEQVIFKDVTKPLRHHRSLKTIKNDIYSALNAQS